MLRIEKPAIVGGAPTLNDSDSAVMAKGHVYKAQTAGFVNAKVVATSSVQIYIANADNGPASGSSIKITDTYQTGSSEYANVMAFLPKDYYFDVTATGTPYIYWTPLISGGGAPIDQD